MRTWKRAAAAVLAAVILCMCGTGKDVRAAQGAVPQAVITETAYKLRDPQPGTFGERVIHVTRSSVALTPASAAAFPALNAALQQFYSKPEGKAETTYNQALGEFTTPAEGGGFGIIVFNDTEQSFIVRADQDVFSVGFYRYFYGGGPHGYKQFGGVSFDAKDGHQIHLSELITDDSLLHQALEQELRYEYPGHAEYWQDLSMKLSRFIIHGDSWNNEGLQYEDMRNPYDWVLTPDGVCFYFNEYSIGAYFEGYFKVLLPFDQYKGLYTGKYGKAAGDWAQNIAGDDSIVFAQNGHTVHLDISGDWDYDEAGEDADCRGLLLDYSAKAFDRWDIPADAFSKSLVFTGGRYYLYVFCENTGKSATYIYDLNGRQPVRIAALQDGNAHVVYDAEVPVARVDGKTFYHSGGQTVRYAFSDLQQLVFTRGRGLGAYRVGADGKPVRQ